jgi:hypothetical protein
VSVTLPSAVVRAVGSTRMPATPMRVAAMCEGCQSACTSESTSPTEAFASPNSRAVLSA